MRICGGEIAKLSRAEPRGHQAASLSSFAAAGIDRLDLTHLDEAYLKRLRESKTPNLAIEALRRLIEQPMRRTTRHNVVRQQS